MTAAMPTDPKKHSAVDDEGPSQEIRQPIQRPHSRKRSMLPWLAAGGCGVLALLSCILCGSVWMWYQHSRFGPQAPG